MEKNPRENRVLKTRFHKLQKNAAIGLKNVTIGLKNATIGPPKLVTYKIFAGKRRYRSLKRHCNA